MNKLLTICILIITVVFISGCTSDEKTNSETSTGDAQIPDVVIKSDVVDGIPFRYSFLYVVPQNNEIKFNGISFPESFNKSDDVPPDGTKKVGENWEWDDGEGRISKVIYIKYDSTDNFLTWTDGLLSDAKYWKMKGTTIDYGNPEIGDFSIWTESKEIDYGKSEEIDKNIHATESIFTYTTLWVRLSVIDDKDKSRDEALRIAQLIKDRLN